MTALLAPCRCGRVDLSRWHCDACPFRTSHEDARRGHEAGIPGGWLGHEEVHAMHERTEETRCPRCGSIDSPRGCMNADCPRWEGPQRPSPCGAIWTSNVLGGQDICARPAGHAGGHDWRERPGDR